MSPLHLGPLSLDTPRVIGTVLSAGTFATLPPDTPSRCDIVEARLDAFDLTDLPATLRAIERARSLGIPVIATLRLPRDGGHWPHPETDRLPLLEQALHTADTIDIEAESALRPALTALAASLHKPIILSHHDFTGTPPYDTLNTLLEDLLLTPHALPKLALLTRTPADILPLLRLAAAHAASRPLCLMGMGAPGTPTRSALPALATKFTYGYLDRPSAPGQKSSTELLHLLRQQNT